MTDTPTPPWLEQLTKERNEFLEWVGRCIVGWADTDEQLFDVFHQAIGTPKLQAAIVYYKFQTIGSRLGLVNDVVASHYPKKPGGKNHPDLIHWKGIFEIFDGLLETRNRLAHQQVHASIYAPGDEAKNGGVMPNAFMQLEIYMSRTQAIAHKGRPSEPLSIKDLKAHALNVSRLTSRLEIFSEDVMSKLPR